MGNESEVVVRHTTLGGSRVRIGFNPSSNETVDRIKVIAASAIDLCEEMRRGHLGTPLPNTEVLRLLSLAQTAFEEAAMWAVKAATA